MRLLSRPNSGKLFVKEPKRNMKLVKSRPFYIKKISSFVFLMTRLNKSVKTGHYVEFSLIICAMVLGTISLLEYWNKIVPEF